MTPEEVLQRLVEAGRLAEESLPTAGPERNWKDWLRRAKGGVGEAIEARLRPLDEARIDETIAFLTRKQEQLLGGRPLASLPTEAVLQYSTLGSARERLVAARVGARLDADFMSWLVDDALPVLQRIGPILVALL